MPKTRTPQFPIAFQLLPFIPILLGAISQSIDSNVGIYAGWASLAALVAVAVVYVLQLRFLQQHAGKKLMAQRTLVAAAFALPLAGVVVGDVLGQAHYGSYAADGGLTFMSAAAVIFGLSVVNLCAMANVYIIRPIINTSAQTKKALHILGILVQILLWGSIVAASFIGAMFAESLRNPATD